MMNTKLQKLSVKAILTRIALVLVGFVIAVWAAGEFYVPYKVTGGKATASAKLAPTALFVTQIELEEEIAFLDTLSLVDRIKDEFGRQNLNSIEFVKNRSSKGQSLANKKENANQSTNDATNRVLSLQGDDYLSLAKLQEASMQRQILIFSADNVSLKGATREITSVEWYLVLLEGKKQVWKGTIKRQSNGLLEALRNAKRLYDFLPGSEAVVSNMLKIENSDQAKIAQLLVKQMRQDELITVQK
jgi:hypothetical protein